jgi:hypothetical protein
MNWLTGLWLLLCGAIAILLITRQTRWYELLVLGGWGLMTGALLAGARSWSGITLGHLWGAFF